MDISAGIIEGGTVSEPTVIATIYFEKGNILPKFNELVDYCRNHSLPLICGIDCNSHSPLWGSPETDKQGEKLEELIFQNNMYVQNVGTTPTWATPWRRGDQKSIIDITLTLSARNRVSNWHVSPEQSMSDLGLISFCLDEPHPGKVLTRNYSKANWKTFAEVIDTKLEDPPTLWSNQLMRVSITKADRYYRLCTGYFLSETPRQKEG